jgi:hypothetical protein
VFQATVLRHVFSYACFNRLDRIATMPRKVLTTIREKLAEPLNRDHRSHTLTASFALCSIRLHCT